VLRIVPKRSSKAFRFSTAIACAKRLAVTVYRSRKPMLPSSAFDRWGGRGGGRVSGVCLAVPDRIVTMASSPKRIVLSEPDVAGAYELVERRVDGSLLLRPERERLSDVQRKTAGRVFRDEEFIAHLERVAASEDDLPADQPA
jgi:hypothetical protein